VQSTLILPSKIKMETHELNFEEYRALIRAIKNVEILLGYRSFDDDSEPEFESEVEPDLGYESGNESELEIIQDDVDLQDKSAHVNINSKTKADEGIENN